MTNKLSKLTEKKKKTNFERFDRVVKSYFDKEGIILSYYLNRVIPVTFCWIERNLKHSN